MILGYDQSTNRAIIASPLYAKLMIEADEQRHAKQQIPHWMRSRR